MFFLKPRIKKQVSFATSCFEKDWRKLLQEENYLKEKLIEAHRYPFAERILVINNVKDPQEVLFWAEKLKAQTILTQIYFAEELEEQMLAFFQLKKSDFKAKEKEGKDEWVYYNARGVLTALWRARGDFLLYQTGDVWLEQKVSWIDQALALMENHSDYKVANLTWNGRFDEMKREASYKQSGFWVAESGFSDQQFLVRTADFKKPIFQEIRQDAEFFPWGETFEKRVFSFMKNHAWKRITYSKGTYHHQSF